jgi:hypothetical protein
MRIPVWASWSLLEHGSRLMVSHYFSADFMPAVISSSSLRLCRESTLMGMSDVERWWPSLVIYLRMSFEQPGQMSRN